MIVLKLLIRFLTSTKVGLVVMISLAVLSLFGAIIPQHAEDTFYIEEYGHIVGSLVVRFGLDHIFGTDYYGFLLVLLCVMVFACALKRLPQVIRLSRHPGPISRVEALKKQPCHAELTLDVDCEEARLHIVDILKRRFYRVAYQVEGERCYLQAAKNAFSLYGSFILHVSFILLLAGGIAIARFGRQVYEDVRVGDSFDFVAAGDETVTVTVDDFVVETDDEGKLHDYVCEAEITGGLIGRRWYRIRPNHPFVYGGTEVYLESYDQDADNPCGFVVTVYDSTGDVVVPHVFVPTDEFVELGEANVTLRADAGIVPTIREIREGGSVVTHLIHEDPGEALGDSSSLRFVLIHAVPSLVVTLKVVQEPGQILIIVGLIMLTAGTLVSLYLSHRKIWFIVEAIPEGRSRVFLGGRSNKHLESFAAEFEAIRGTLDELS